MSKATDHLVAAGEELMVSAGDAIAEMRSIGLPSVDISATVAGALIGEWLSAGADPEDVKRLLCLLTDTIVAQFGGGG